MKNPTLLVFLILIVASKVMCFSYWSDGYENFPMSPTISSYPVFISDNVTNVMAPCFNTAFFRRMC